MMMIFSLQYSSGFPSIYFLTIVQLNRLKFVLPKRKSEFLTPYGWQISYLLKIFLKLIKNIFVSKKQRQTKKIEYQMICQRVFYFINW